MPNGTLTKNTQRHENESVKKLYETFLKEPLGHKSHELLHTCYVCRGLDVLMDQDDKKNQRK